MSTVNSAAMNIGVHVFLNYCFFFFFLLSLCPGVELLGHYSSIFSFLRNLQLLFIVAILIYIPTNNVGRFPFFFSVLTPSLQQTGIACSHSRTWVWALWEETSVCKGFYSPLPPAGPVFPLLRAVHIEDSMWNKATVAITHSFIHSVSFH